jgi:archaellum biogenesis ATPase FlaH/5S rRNA maturation endonuclease (ribonuclease M5)
MDSLKEVVEEIKNQINPEQVKEKIANDLKLQLKNDKCLCFLHGEKTPSMSFDKKHKMYFCFGCHQSYDIFNHYQECFNLSFIEAVKQIIQDFHLNIQFGTPKTDRKPKKEPTNYTDLSETACKYLNTRKISNKTIKYAGIKSDFKNNLVFEYKNELGQHVSNKYRPARKISKDDIKMWFQRDTNTNTLYNMDKVNITEPLVITEGECDTLSMIEAGYRNVVSIPTGAASFEWLEANYSFLEQFNEVILWYDNDKTGKTSVGAISPRLPNNIVKIVRMKHDVKDINELLYRYGPDAVLATLRDAQESPLENVINPLDIAEFNVFEAEKIKSGIAQLDDLILGFVMGTVDIITGYNGSGKSTIVNQLYVAEPISQGYKTFVYSGELTRSNLLYWITQTICLEQDLVECSTKEGKKYKKTSDKASKQIKEWLNDKLFIYDNDSDNTASTILNTMEKLAKRKGIRCFVLDNLMTINLQCNTRDELKAQSDFMSELKKFAIKYNAVVHLVAHPRKQLDESRMVGKMDVCGSGDITNLADYVTAVHRYTERQKEKGGHDYDSSILLFKNRPTGKIKENGIGMYFSVERKRFYKQESDLDKNYGYVETADFYEVEPSEEILTQLTS